jgi:hypothetical protein
VLMFSALRDQQECRIASTILLTRTPCCCITTANRPPPLPLAWHSQAAWKWIELGVGDPHDFRMNDCKTPPVPKNNAGASRKNGVPTSGLSIPGIDGPLAPL